MKHLINIIKESKQSFRIFDESKHSFRIKSHLKKEDDLKDFFDDKFFVNGNTNEHWEAPFFIINSANVKPCNNISEVINYLELVTTVYVGIYFYLASFPDTLHITSPKKAKNFLNLAKTHNLEKINVKEADNELCFILNNVGDLRKLFDISNEISNL